MRFCTDDRHGLACPMPCPECLFDCDPGAVVECTHEFLFNQNPPNAQEAQDECTGEACPAHGEES